LQPLTVQVPLVGPGMSAAEMLRYDPRLLSSYDAQTRRSELSLADYLDAVDHAISRQQALADLRSSHQLRVQGHGRGQRRRPSVELTFGSRPQRLVNPARVPIVSVRLAKRPSDARRRHSRWVTFALTASQRRC
jgi:hypothetical protein